MKTWRWFATDFGVNAAIVLFNAILIGIMWNVVFALVRTERQDSIQAAIDRNDNLAIAFEQYAVRTLQNADAITQNLVREYASRGRQIDLARFMSEYTVADSVIIGVVLADERGNAMSTAYSSNFARPLNVTDREHFSVHFANDNGRLFVGKPVLGRVSGQGVIPVTRRINKADGAFGGVAMALIEPARFTDILRDAKLRPLDVISLVGLDGITRARLSGTVPSWGEDIGKSPLFAEQARHPIGNYFARGQRDNVLRYFSYRTLADYPMMATVGTSEADVLSEFYITQKRYIWAAGLTSAIIVTFAFLLMLVLARQRRASAADAARYRAVTQSAEDAIVTADSSGIIIGWNPGAERTFGYAETEVAGQPLTLLIPERFRKRHLDGILRVQSGGERRVIGKAVELIGRRKDASEFPLDLSLAEWTLGQSQFFTANIRDITKRKQAVQMLAESEEQFRSLTAMSSDFYWQTDAEHRLLARGPNSKAVKVSAFASDAQVGLRRWEVPHLSPDEAAWQAHRAVLDAHQAFRDFALSRISADGTVAYFLISGEPVFDASGVFIGYRGVGNNITERTRSDERIRRLNRVYAMLSGINSLILRTHGRDELFAEACRIAVEEGQFRMAWVGVIDRSAMNIVPVASAGANPEFAAGFVEEVRHRLSLRSGAANGNGPAALAVNEKRAEVVNNVETDPRVRYKKSHLDRGVRSFVVLPLLIADEVVAVFSLHAAQADYFDAEEMKLLTELAGDIAFAIDYIAKQERLDYLAYYDVLTGLANRSLFEDRVGLHLRGAANAGHKLALFLIDIERFKNINDSLGQPSGDALLRLVAAWLTQYAGDATLLARVNADHFAVLLPAIKQDFDVALYVDKTMAAFMEHPYRLNDAVFRIAAKAGVAIFPDDGDDADTLFRNAEAALKKAKASGERYLFYSRKMTDAVAGKLTLENQLRQALDNEEFVLHYQPKVSLSSGKLTSAEALIRWNDPRTGLVPPGRFIPILEETGLIYDVGRWALRKALEDYLRWRAAGLAAVRIAVNVSPLQLRNTGFITEIGEAISIDAHAAAGLELEITESLIMEDVKHSIASLQAIRAMGVSIAIDDFGTGFSSLSYLSKLPVDALKIDRSFIIDMTLSPEGLSLVSTIINLAHSLKLKVVAEGVETEEQSQLLRLLSCDEMQGFLFSKPVPAGIFEEKFLAAPAVR